MIEATLKWGHLKEFLERPMSLNDEVKLKVSKDGFRVLIVDPAHCAMMDTSLNLSAFDKLDYRNDEPQTEIFIDFGKTFKNLRLLPTTMVKITYPVDEEWTTKVNDKEIVAKGQFLQIEYNDVVRQVLIDEHAMDGMADPKWPNFQLPNSLSIRKSDLISVINDIAHHSDHCRFKCLKSGFVVDNHPGEGTDPTVRIRKLFREDALNGYSFKDETISLYSLDYISNILKILGRTHYIQLEQGTDYPIRITWDHTSGETIIGKGVYLLAPRIEND